MCDYALEMYASRPARESEKYVTTRFSSGSIGLASPGDWTTAVCVQYDTRLKLEGIPSDLQPRLIYGQGRSCLRPARLWPLCGRYKVCRRDSLQLLGSGVSI